MDRVEMTKSLEVKVPHFQKDVIIPHIYDLKNIRIIQQHGYKSSPVNKVAQLKKEKIQKVIRSIVYKEKVHQAQPKALYKSLTLNLKRQQLPRQPSYSKDIHSARNDNLFMEIDEQIGEMIALADENFVPFAERVKSALGKVKDKVVSDKNMAQKNQDAEYFMNVLCKGANKRINPEQIKPVSGLLEEIEEMQKRGKSRPVKQRAKSANLSRAKSSVQHSPHLYRPKDLNKSSTNLRQKNGLEDQLNKSKQLIKSINDCLQQQSKINKRTRGGMSQMKSFWGSSGPVQQTFIRSSSLVINPSTLDALKDKRLRIQALSRIDNEYVRK